MSKKNPEKNLPTEDKPSTRDEIRVKKAPFLAKFASLASGTATLARICSSIEGPGFSPLKKDGEPTPDELLDSVLKDLTLTLADLTENGPLIMAKLKNENGYESDRETSSKHRAKLVSALPFPLDVTAGRSIVNNHWGAVSSIAQSNSMAAVNELLASAKNLASSGWRGHHHNRPESLPVAVFSTLLSSERSGLLSPEWIIGVEKTLRGLLQTLEAAPDERDLEAVASELSKAVCSAFSVGDETRLFFPVHGFGLKISKLRNADGVFSTAYAYSPVSNAKASDPHAAERGKMEADAIENHSFGERLDAKARTVPGEKNLLPSCLEIQGAADLPIFSDDIFDGYALSFSNTTVSAGPLNDPDARAAKARLRGLSIMAQAAATGADVDPISIPGNLSASFSSPFNLVNPMNGAARLASTRRVNANETMPPRKPDPAGAALALAGIVTALDIAVRETLSCMDPSGHPPSGFLFPKTTPRGNTGNDNFLFSRANLSRHHVSDEKMPEALLSISKMASALSFKADSLRTAADLSLRVVRAFSERTLKLENRALEIARARELAWFANNGLADAFEAARIGNAKGVSGRHLAFYAQNPETAKAAIRAHKDPEGRLAMALSRCAGLSRAEDSESLKSSLVASCAGQGLSEPAFKAASAYEPLSKILSAAAASVFEDNPRIANTSRLQTLRTMFRAVSAWHSYGGADPEGFAKSLGAFFKNDKIQGNSYLNFLSSSDMEPIAVETVESSSVVMKRALAKNKLSERLSFLCVTALAPDANESARLFANKAGGGLLTMRRWEDFRPDASHADIVLGIPAGVSKAAEDLLLESTPQGLCALRGALLSEAALASSPNELTSIGREALKGMFGFSNAAWKSLSDADVSSALMKTLDSEIFRTERFDGIYSQGTFGTTKNNRAETMARWLGWGAMMNFPQPASKTFLSLAFENQRNQYNNRTSFDQVWGLLGPLHPVSVAPANIEQARIAMDEMNAREARAPHIAKALCERLAWHLKNPPEPRPEEESNTPANRSTNAFKSELDLLYDWISRSEGGFWQALPEKPTWGQMFRLQADWHEAVAAGALRDPSARGDQWHVLTGNHSDGGLWNAREMANGNDLLEEGKAMHHCVSSYSGNCKRGECRIFSITRGGERVCTLQLAPRVDGRTVNFSSANPDSDTVWTIVQNKGNCNAHVDDPATLAFCEATAKAANAAHLKLCEERAKARAEAAEKAAATRKSKAKDRTFSIIDDKDLGVEPEQNDNGAKSMAILAGMKKARPLN